ncbi:hypothetical protein ACFVJS_24215 [Nocardioides sp. NPDC057772]|uniref:hypothetical protein n=1 Tax=Nocardioides sp. NPDC057772 TaxID=3346245 RepID=UPI0036734E7F
MNQGSEPSERSGEDLVAAWKSAGDAARKQLRDELGEDVAKGAQWPAPARGTFEIHLFDGAWVRVWHEPHSMTGRVRGLRPVSDGGPLALLLDFGSRGLHAARPADGSAWTTHISTDAVTAENSQTPVTVWLGIDDAEVIAPPDEPWQVEDWTMRTAPRLELL